MAIIKIGDVFSIQTKNGKIFFQYVFKNKTLGELIRILPGIFKKNDINFEKIVNENEIFIVHFSLNVAVKKGIVNFIGNFDLPPNFQKPKYMRSKKTDGNGKLISWQIIDYENWSRTNVTSLSEDQIKLSPWGTWNDTLLIDRLNEGWSLEKWI